MTTREEMGALAEVVEAAQNIEAIIERYAVQQSLTPTDRPFYILDRWNGRAGQRFADAEVARAHAVQQTRDEIVAALRSLGWQPPARERPEVAGWRPIDEAEKKDGALILACLPHGKFYVRCIARWNKHQKRWYDTDHESSVAYPNGSDKPAFYLPLTVSLAISESPHD